MAYKLLGVEVDTHNLEDLLSLIQNRINTKTRLIVASQNFHSIYLARTNKFIRDFQKLAVKRIDGMPIIYIGKLLGYPFLKEHRVTWVDLIYPLMNKAGQCNWKVFYLGADEKTVSKGIETLRLQNPSLNIAFRNGFFNSNIHSDDNKKVVNLINKFAPDLLIVGMGMSRQEKWILENLNDLKPTVIMTCGAAIEYVAGTVKTPPRWMGRAGLEAVYRFVENPKRFWYRYLVEPWFVLGLFAKDFTQKYLFRKEIA